MHGVAGRIAVMSDEEKRWRRSGCIEGIRPVASKEMDGGHLHLEEESVRFHERM